MNQDDYTHSGLEAKYDDMDAAKLAAMTTEERGEYYHAMYQYFARMLFIVHEPLPEMDGSSYVPSQEYFALGAAYHAFHSLIDGLAGLVWVMDKKEPQNEQ